MASGPCLRRCRVVRRYMPIKLLDYRFGVKPEYSIHVPMYFESFREGNTVNTGGLCPQMPIHRKLGVNNVAFGDSGDTTERPAPLSGTAQQMIDTIKRYEDAGVQHIVLGIRGRDAKTMIATARRFVDEVRPHVEAT